MSVVEAIDEDLVQQLLGCSDDPLAFVRLAYPDIRPEKWQREVLETIGSRLIAKLPLEDRVCDECVMEFWRHSIAPLLPRSWRRPPTKRTGH